MSSEYVRERIRVNLTFTDDQIIELALEIKRIQESGRYIDRICKSPMGEIMIGIINDMAPLNNNIITVKIKEKNERRKKRTE